MAQLCGCTAAPPRHTVSVRREASARSEFSPTLSRRFHLRAAKTLHGAVLNGGVLKDAARRSLGRVYMDHDIVQLCDVDESTRACYERAEQCVVPCLEEFRGDDWILGPVQPRWAASTVKTVRSVADGSDLDFPEG